MPHTRNADSETHPGAVLGLGIFILGAVYVFLFLAGWRFIIVKTAVLPVFVLYGVALRSRRQFLADWLPLLAATILFDALRGAIFAGIQHGYPHVYTRYVIFLERSLLGTPAATLVLQRWREPWLDVAATGLHAMHFAFFLIFGLVVWHTRPALFAEYRRSLVLVMGSGIVGYFFIPTVPPWLASSYFHLLPQIPRVLEGMYTVFPQEIYGAFDTNPVAAMPSLHAAFPVTCALIAGRGFRASIATLVWAYAFCVIAAIVYLGEHYAVDTIAGIGVASVAVAIARRPWARSQTLRTSVAVSLSIIAITLIALAATQWIQGHP